MKVKDLVDTVYARTITIVEEEGGVTKLGPHGWGFAYTILLAIKEFGEREVIGIWDMGSKKANYEVVIGVK